MIEFEIGPRLYEVFQGTGALLFLLLVAWTWLKFLELGAKYDS